MNTDANGEIERLHGLLARHRRLVEASYALHTTLDLDELLRVILDTAKEGVNADRGTVFLVTEEGGELWSRVIAGGDDLEIRLPIGKGIAGHVAQTGETLRIDDARRDPRFDSSWDEQSGYETKQILTAPIRRRDGVVVGVFQLLNKRSGAFDEEDEDFLASLSIHTALALENARLHRAEIEKERQDREIGLVQNVQRAYQPEHLTREVGVLETAGLNQLCEDASGDYYDVFDVPSGQVAVTIGDVSGHGLGAALVMAQARALLRAFAQTVDGLAEVMNLLNDSLTRDMSAGRFMSLFVLIADPATGEIRWQSAGHPPAFLLRAATGEIERLDPQGRVLGVLEDAGFHGAPTCTLEQGDVLLLYTDGATEARDPAGTMLDEAGLEEALKRAASGSPAGILEAVRDRLVEWTGRATFGDDLTLVALKRRDS